MSLTIANQNSGWRAVKRIVLTAALAGLVAGLCLTAAQQWQVSPLIQQAEVYEDAARDTQQPAGQSPAHAHIQAHSHAHSDVHSLAASTATAQPEAVQHEAKEWQPENGSERLFYTTLANISMATGFGLLLAAAMHLHGGAASVRSALVWGMAGYLVFFVAPSIGLRPELPGTEAAPLAARQLWWLSTVVAAAAGLALLLLARVRLKLVGLVVLVLPYLVGAPHLDVAGGSTPAALSHAFVLATAFANGVLWLTLGVTVAYFYRKTGD